MDRLGTTIARLTARKTMSAFTMSAVRGDRLRDLDGFGSNPGTLRARSYIPAGLPEGAPLVVVLHGCTQNAAAYDQGSGWSQLADELGFALLYPEQQRTNNANLCFNWFSLADARRGSGETLSIKQMVDTLVADYRLDATRVFVTGLSAGGAMASIMLASYPDVFAGGAIIAGLPFGNANSVGDAFARMRGRGYASDTQLETLVRHASEHSGPWPKVSVWHGSADTTVDPSNAQRIVDQWRGVHRLGDIPDRIEVVHGVARQCWADASGRTVIESYRIPGFGHGTPLSTLGQDACGTPGPFMLEAGISSTRCIAAFWGLSAADSGLSKTSDAWPAARGAAASNVTYTTEIEAGGHSSTSHETRSVAEPDDQFNIGTVIENALRSAGLMR